MSSPALQSAAEIEQAPLRTIWRDRLIIGALNLIAGEPGAGKSSLTALIGAELSRQGHTVVISNCEDDPATVTVPRLAVADAVLERIHIIPPEDAPLFPKEVEALEYVIREAKLKVIILDPIGAHFKPERMAHDRPALRQLAAVARRTSCAIVAIHHTTKSGEVGGPNSGLIGTCRAVYVYGNDPADEDRRALSCEKINGVEQPATLLFEHETVEYELGGRLVGAGRLRKVRQSTSRAQRQRGKKDHERDAACHTWLVELLGASPEFELASKEIEARGKAEGFSQATLRRAKIDLQIDHARVGGWGANGHWVWRLPDDHPLRNPPEEEPEG